MVKYPLSTTVQEAFRSALGIADCPQFIDTETPISPVVVLAQANTPSIAQFTKITDGTNTLTMTSNGAIKTSPLTRVLTDLAVGANVVFTAPSNCTVKKIILTNSSTTLHRFQISIAGTEYFDFTKTNTTDFFREIEIDAPLTTGQTINITLGVAIASVVHCTVFYEV